MRYEFVSIRIEEIMGFIHEVEMVCSSVYTFLFVFSEGRVLESDYIEATDVVFVCWLRQCMQSLFFTDIWIGPMRNEHLNQFWIHILYVIENEWFSPMIHEK